MLVLGLVVPILMIFLLDPLVPSRGKGPLADVQRAQNNYLNKPEVKEAVTEVVDTLLSEFNSNPDRVYDIEFMDNLNEKLIPIGAQMIASSLDDQMIYSSNDFEIPSRHTKDELVNMKENVRVVDMDFRFLIHKILHVKTTDGTPVNIMILTQFGEFTKMKLFIIRNLLVLVTAFALVYIVLVYYVTKSINKPLDRLKEANEKLSQGEFTHRIGIYTNDKIGEVSKGFDYMLEKIEENVRIRMKYAEDRKELIASISHDLKTPLTAIKVNAAAINDGIADTMEKKTKAFNIITNKIDYMQHLIEELFLYSKLDMDKQAFNFQDVPLHRFMEDVIEEWELEHDPEKVRVSLEYEKGNDFIMPMDVEKMKRVVVNILENSIKYSGVSPLLLHIGIKEQEGKYIIKMNDNGVGVPEEELSKLFERFYRVDVSRNSETAGSGLGLAISKRIVEGHNGRVYAESGVNQGMHIFIEFDTSAQEEVYHETNLNSGR